MIAIIDYGVGNIRAFANVYKKLNVPVTIAQTEKDLDGINKIILPGVGAFDHAISKLNASGMLPRVEEMVLKNNVPVIGICVGMQMLAKSSDEGKLPGLGWVDATVKKFDTSKIHSTTRLPHMGWNDVKPKLPVNPLFSGLETDAKFYFLHSYYFCCHDPAIVIASADYGDSFACAINYRNIYGVQCHPEKSHHYGVRLLENFSKL
ncbi:MAG: imidazole glycerol phosphate synthase subunit HisH [Ferruginibacter sp.]